MGSLEIKDTYITPGKKYSTEILKEDSPDVSIISHLNTAYCFVDFPNTSTRLSSIYRMQAYIVEYDSLENGSLNPDAILSELRVEFDPGRSVYANNQPELPEHHFVTDLNNSWYIFKFTYMYKPSTEIDGSDIWYSAVSSTRLDNTTPNIFSKYISGNIRGNVKTVLEKNKELRLWYNLSTLPKPAIGQSIKYSTEPTINQVQRVYDGSSFVREPLSPDMKNIWTKLLNDKNFQLTVYTYFNNWLPVSGNITFKFRWNKDIYTLVIDGDIQALAKDYFEEVKDG